MESVSVTCPSQANPPLALSLALQPATSHWPSSVVCLPSFKTSGSEISFDRNRTWPLLAVTLIRCQSRSCHLELLIRFFDCHMELEADSIPSISICYFQGAMRWVLPFVCLFHGGGWGRYGRSIYVTATWIHTTGGERESMSIEEGNIWIEAVHWLRRGHGSKSLAVLYKSLVFREVMQIILYLSGRERRGRRF